MGRPLSLPLLALLALLALGEGLASAQSVPPAAERPTREERIERNRERWRRLSPEQRTELRRIHEAYRRLSPEKRAAFEERLGRLDPERRERLVRNHRRFSGCGSGEREDLRQRHLFLERWRRGLSPEEQARLAALSPEEVRQEVRRWLEQRISAHRAALPEADRGRFDALSPREQMQELRRADHRDRLSEEEQLRFDALPSNEQMREVGDAARPPRRALPPELLPHAEGVKALPRESIRELLRSDYFQGGALPAGLPIGAELRAALEALPTPDRLALRGSLGRMPRERREEDEPTDRRPRR